jgi:dethiobiotin synthetase
MRQSIFITGTNTDIGKTFISAMMMSAAKTHGIELNYFKPLQSGDDDDCVTVKNLSHCEDEKIFKPTYSFAMPATPYLAALAENKKIDRQKVQQHFLEASKQAPCLVEGAGGLLAPVCEKTTVRDLIKTLDLPALLVASTTLGTMNHTLLTIESMLNAGIEVKGIILSGDEYPDLVEVLHLFSPIKVIAEVPKIHATDFAQQSAKIFDKPLLMNILSWESK